VIGPSGRVFVGTLLALSLPAGPARAASADAPGERAEALTEVVVVGSRARAQSLAGAAQVLDAADLRDARVLTVNEALRKVPGVYARDEEGLGLRPNIGIRGLNPTRSSKVLLLEDGLPLAFAPYGDNATYYHPSFERFERIEVLKNAGQIAFGPQTIGGLVNYISPRAPESFEAGVTAQGGDHGLRGLTVDLGDRVDTTGTGWRMVANRKHSDGTRENVDLDVTDAALRVEQELGGGQSLTLRASGYRERSQVPYSGLTLAEFRADPRANAFRDDLFAIDRTAFAATHGVELGATPGAARLQTSLYHTRLQRDWWRQSSNSRQRPNDASDPACKDMRNLHTTCGNEGRVRGYRTTGVEPRLSMEGRVAGAPASLRAGFRLHEERQHRLQLNGDTPWARTAGVGPNAGVREDNEREVEARAAFIEASVSFGRLTLSPGLRREEIGYTRTNRLTGLAGESRLTQWIPGVGATVEIAPTLTVYGGLHRGFAPPRVEDIVGNDGGSVELDAELSWNSELGLRWQPTDDARLEVAVFDMDFENQIVAASLAGGIGAGMTNAGRTRHRGVEIGGEIERELRWSEMTMRPYARLAYTWLPVARYEGERFSAVPGAATVSVTGNRLPYAAAQQGTLALGLRLPRGVTAQLEADYTGSLYTDDLNTAAITADGQRGRIGGRIVWNATLQWSPSNTTTLFATVKNATDRLYIADLSRGILPGAPRQLAFGVEHRFR
jgi:Fe(3+) dicitrate transport protein